jgi:hypothetical protein
LYGHGWRPRHVVVRGEKVWHEVHRLRCKDCGKCVTVLLENMTPYARYEAGEVERELRGPVSASECGAERSTIARWGRVILDRAGRLLASLSARAGFGLSLASGSGLWERLDELRSRLGGEGYSSGLAWLFGEETVNPVCVS